MQVHAEKIVILAADIILNSFFFCSDQNKFMHIAVELAPNVAETADIKQQIAESILTHLRKLNSEFANYVPVEKQHPTLTLRAHGDPEYFPIGVKHRYTRQATTTSTTTK
jgi:phenylacetate-CoA ligase